MAERLIHVHQGECRISEDTAVVLTTMLGSCIAACLHDPTARVGGMNHFLLSEADGDEGASLRYGAYAMELLVNGLLSIGARREKLVAKLFGGSRLREGLADIGAKNAIFAERYLQREHIPILGGGTGGHSARRIQFWPVSARVRQLALAVPPEKISTPQLAARHAARNSGSVELF